MPVWIGQEVQALLRRLLAQVTLTRPYTEVTLQLVHLVEGVLDLATYHHLGRLIATRFTSATVCQSPKSRHDCTEAFLWSVLRLDESQNGILEICILYVFGKLRSDSIADNGFRNRGQQFGNGVLGFRAAEDKEG